MFDDGEAEAGPARFPAARGIDPIEALGHARQMLARNAGAMVSDTEEHPRTAALGGDGDFGTGPVAAVAQRVANQIVEQLDELHAVAAHRREVGSQIELKLATTA